MHIEDGTDPQSRRFHQFVDAAQLQQAVAPLETELVRKRCGAWVRSRMDDRRTFEEIVEAAGWFRYNSASITVRGRAIGMLHADRPEPDGMFTMDHLDQLETFAEFLSVVFESVVLEEKAAPTTGRSRQSVRQRRSTAQRVIRISVAVTAERVVMVTVDQRPASHFIDEPDRTDVGRAADRQPPSAAQSGLPRRLTRVVNLRRAWSKLASIPVRSTATVGRGVMLTAAVVRYSVTDALTMRLPWGETVFQAWTLLKVTAIPALLMAIPFGGLLAVQVSGFVNQVGATSLIGAASGMGMIRQGAPIVAGLLMGGAASSAIASDFGARAIREELDAMRVIGVDPARHLVVPRFVALLLIAPILCAIIIASAVATSYILALVVSDVAPGSFWNSFGSFASVTDLWFALAKTAVFAAIVAIVSSLRGMEAKGGPRGVADAVNSSVVLNVICIMFANLAITQVQTMFFPMELA